MNSLPQLRTLIEQRFNCSVRNLDDTSLRSLLCYDIDEMRRNGFDPSTIEYHEEFNKRMEMFVTHPQIGTYLRHLTTSDGIEASGIGLMALESIKPSVGEGCGPGGYIFPFGYLPIGGSGGGNALCVHSPSGEVGWADHEGFSDVTVNYRDVATGDWRTVELKEENVKRGIIPLSPNLESFLHDLLNDRLTAKLAVLA
jgi:hypothetical protein